MPVPYHRSNLFDVQRVPNKQKKQFAVVSTCCVHITLAVLKSDEDFYLSLPNLYIFSNKKPLQKKPIVLDIAFFN